MASDKHIKINVDWSDLDKGLDKARKKIENVSKEVERTSHKSVYRDPATGRFRSVEITQPARAPQVSEAQLQRDRLYQQQLDAKILAEQRSGRAYSPMEAWAKGIPSSLRTGRPAAPISSRSINWQEHLRETALTRAGLAEDYAKGLISKKEFRKQDAEAALMQSVARRMTGAGGQAGGGGGLGGIGGALRTAGGMIGGTTGGLLSAIGGATGPLALLGAGIYGGKVLWNMAEKFKAPMLGLHGLGLNVNQIGALTDTGLTSGYGPVASMGMANQLMRATSSGMTGGIFDMALKASRQGIGFETLASAGNVAYRSGAGQRGFEAILTKAFATGLENAKIDEYLKSTVSLLSDMLSQGPTEAIAVSNLVSSLTAKGGSWFTQNPNAAANAVGALNRGIQGQAFGGPAFGILAPMVSKSMGGGMGAFDISMRMTAGLFGNVEGINALPSDKKYYKSLFGNNNMVMDMARGLSALDPRARASTFNAMGITGLQKQAGVSALINNILTGKPGDQEKAIEEFSKTLSEANEDIMQTVAGKMERTAAATEAIQQDLSINGHIMEVLSDIAAKGMGKGHEWFKQRHDQYYTLGEGSRQINEILSDAGVKGSFARSVGNEWDIFGTQISGWGISREIVGEKLEKLKGASEAQRLDAARGGGRTHKGIDETGPLGSPIQAFATLKVLEANNKAGGKGGSYIKMMDEMGNIWIQRHGIYDTNLVGKTLLAGEQYGKMWNIGNATKGIGVQHWEVTTKGGKTDPIAALEALSTPVGDTLRQAGVFGDPKINELLQEGNRQSNITDDPNYMLFRELKQIAQNTQQSVELKEYELRTMRSSTPQGASYNVNGVGNGVSKITEANWNETFQGMSQM